MFNSHGFRPLIATLTTAAAVCIVPTAAVAQTTDAMPAAPLGPYLFAVILAGGGILAALAVRFADKQIQSDHAGWLADGTRKIFGITPIR